jgi:GNAT superfamily N-acetyltransferase
MVSHQQQPGVCVGVLLLPQVLECAVDPGYQSKGIGTALLQHMLDTHRWAGLLLAESGEGEQAGPQLAWQHTAAGCVTVSGSALAMLSACSNASQSTNTFRNLTTAP